MKPMRGPAGSKSVAKWLRSSATRSPRRATTSRDGCFARGPTRRATGKVTPMAEGKVLVVMSSANALDLKDGKTYSTGYYLNEFVVPYRKLVEAGFEPVIANPQGGRPVMDANSNNAMFFGGDDAARADALTFAQKLELLDHPETLAS